MKTPPPSTLNIKRRILHRTRRRPYLTRDANVGPGSLWRVSSSQWNHHPNMAMPPALIQPQEMDLFFQLLEDKVIKAFLKMDSCYKLSDKYLLAMTFVYFKRAHFTSCEFSRINFFIALYLANTMEEDEEKNKYEIFPWALGKNWRKHFPRFLHQRDMLWARIHYRAAVSRRCCDQVMTVGSSHGAWQRKRPPHHSGAQRLYTDQDYVVCPGGPSSRPPPCVPCSRSASVSCGPPPRGRSQVGGYPSIYPEEMPRAEPVCRRLFMDWMDE